MPNSASTEHVVEFHCRPAAMRRKRHSNSAVGLGTKTRLNDLFSKGFRVQKWRFSRPEIDFSAVGSGMAHWARRRLPRNWRTTRLTDKRLVALRKGLPGIERMCNVGGREVLVIVCGLRNFAQPRRGALRAARLCARGDSVRSALGLSAHPDKTQGLDPEMKPDYPLTPAARAPRSRPSESVPLRRR